MSSESSIASPPGAGGGVHPLVAAAAHLLGITEVIAAGGAQAIAAMAYGTDSIDRVDKIVGPGNAFVTLAKHEVFGAVGIDQLAGPSEILVIASAGADAEFIAADLVSQLEHDPLAWAVCLTDDADLAMNVITQFNAAASEAARSEIIGDGRRDATQRWCCAGRCATASTLAAGFAPEHLSLQGAAAEALRDEVRNAGAVFVGPMSPVSIGDYVAGPNHTLPTQGAARYRGPLAVMDFLRWPSFVQLDRSDFDTVAPVARRLAQAEGLQAHEAAIRARIAHARARMTETVRSASRRRDTRETKISADVVIDGTGVALDHAAAALLPPHDRGVHEIQRHGHHAGRQR